MSMVASMVESAPNYFNTSGVEVLFRLRRDGTMAGKAVAGMIQRIKKRI